MSEPEVQSVNSRPPEAIRLNVLQLICSTGFFGAERWILALANNLDEADLQCHLLSTSEDRNARIELLEHYPRSVGHTMRVEMWGRFDPSVIWRIVSLVRRHDIDIVHSHGYKSDLIALAVARFAGVCCVSTPHGYGERHSLKMRTFFRVGSWALRHFDAVAPLSAQLVEDVVSRGVPRQRIRYIANGVDLSEIDLQLKTSGADRASACNRKESQSGRVIGFVGRLVSGKQVNHLLDVFDILWRDDPSLRLRIVGDGPLRGELEAHAADLSSAGNIEFLGFRADRLALVRQCAMIVMTSTSEGIPRSLMEAMALRVPIVAYDIAGVDLLISHDQTGMLAKLGDKTALANCCRRVLNDQGLAHRLARAARERVETDYSAQVMAMRYVQLFRQLADTGQNSST